MPDVQLPSLRRDPVFASALAVLALAVVASFLPLGDSGLTSLMGRALSLVAALLAVSFRPAGEPRRTRAFWRLISVGLLFFFVAQLWQAAAAGALVPALARRQELLYLGRYLFLVMVLELRPDVQYLESSDDALRLLDTAGAVLFLFAVIAYVLVSPEAAREAGPSVSLRTLYLVLDAFLVLRALSLRFASHSAYWRSVYLWLAVLFVLRGVNNLLVMPTYEMVRPIGSDPLSGPIWFLLFVPLIVAARLPTHPIGAVGPSAPASTPRSAGRLAPLVAYAFTFPIFHFMMERLGIVEDETAGPRETVVLVFLGGAALLLWVYQRVLVRENHRLEVERKVMMERAEETRRMEGLGRLAGGVAHDFNNLLTVIRGRTELMLAEQPASAALTEDLEAIRHAARRGEGVTRQLLAFGRRQILRPQVLNLGEVVTQMAPLLQSAVTDEVRVTVKVCDEAPLILADQGQVEMALLNLAVNAREAMPGGGLLSIDIGGVDLDAQAAAEIPEARPGKYVLLGVQDSGRGMDAETIVRIFEPFFTTKPFGSGAGLGLPAVHGFVRQSGGAVTVESLPGRGATFRIYLPRAEEAALAVNGAG